MIAPGHACAAAVPLHTAACTPARPVSRLMHGSSVTGTPLAAPVPACLTSSSVSRAAPRTLSPSICLLGVNARI